MMLRKMKSHAFYYLDIALKVILVCVLVLACFLAFYQVKLAHYFPIKTVRVHGIHRGYQKEVENLVKPLVNRGFFTINVDFIRERLMQIPWVSHLSVHRLWPDRIEITIVEKQPIARWNNQSLLSEAGELFSPRLSTYPASLPIFVGPLGKQVMMLEYFNQMDRLFAPLHVKISYLELTPYLTWKVKLDNGINLQIGHQDVFMRLDHFVKVYGKIVGNRAMDIDYIDLRYSNGLAVRWKSAIHTAS
jgi:cell division protein FtsQ